MEVGVTIQFIIPAISLIIGYCLKVLSDSIESKRHIKRRRIEDKENAYREISEFVFKLFHKYHGLVIQDGLKRATLGTDHLESPLVSLRADFRDLEEVLFKHTLLMEPEDIHALFKLPRLFRLRLIGKHELEIETGISDMNMIQFEGKFWNKLWIYTITVMNRFRKRLGLKPYSQEINNVWEPPTNENVDGLDFN